MLFFRSVSTVGGERAMLSLSVAGLSRPVGTLLVAAENFGAVCIRLWRSARSALSRPQGKQTCKHLCEMGRKWKLCCDDKASIMFTLDTKQNKQICLSDPMAIHVVFRVGSGVSDTHSRNLIKND